MQKQPNGDSHGAFPYRMCDEVDTLNTESHSPTQVLRENSAAVTNGHQTPPFDHDASSPSSRGLKRKLVDPLSNSAALNFKRPVSPPWKRFEAEGPTSFVTEGRRRSGRTNALPLELQPQSGRRQTRASYHLSNDGKRQVHSASASQSKQLSGTSVSQTPPTKTSPRLTNAKLRLRQHPSRDFVKPASPQQKPYIKASPATTNSKDRSDVHYRSQSFRKPVENLEPEQLPLHPPMLQTPARPVKSIRLNFRRPPLPVLNPANILRRRFLSFKEYVEQSENLVDEGEGLFDADRVRQEAGLFQRMEDAAIEGGVLSKPWWLSEDPQPEPILPHTHQDYIATHVDMFVRALRSERARHVKEAKYLAQAAATAAIERWEKKQPQRPKTAKELDKEELQRKKALLKPLLVELRNKWFAIGQFAKQRKLARLEQEQEALGKQALGEMLERSTKALEDRRKRSYGLTGLSHQLQSTSSQVSDAELDENSVSNESDSTSMDDYDDGDSSSSNEEEQKANDEADEDNELSREDLLKKYGDLPNLPAKLGSSRATSIADEPIPKSDVLLSEKDSNSPLPDLDANYPNLEEVDPELLDSEMSKSGSDEESTTDSDEEASVKSGESHDDDDDDHENSSEASDDDQAASLYQLLSAKSKQSLQVEMETRPLQTEAERKLNRPLLISQQETSLSDPNSTSDAQSVQITPPTTIESGSPHHEVGKQSSETVKAETQEPSHDGKSDLKTPMPSLLRGQLREYQHYGLDWLVGMYATDTNGILADEMGLGKTIQTIALLAHLATEQEIWGPHLIVVPTSVMLNWEMEFKKWCPGFKVLTYYGNIEERKAKRRGWTENSCHVCITSYELAVQDASALKRRNWHYLILDEAHNIKNFRSQRWQTLLNFKSQARLLLTGTPLQNNLSELWSLLFFLAPETDEAGKSQFSDLKTFTTSFKHPVEQILDHGRESLDDEGLAIVEKLHKVLRPHLLRRLKSEVEKQMPKKYEHVVKCRLSKRQRQLYDGFMNLAGTRESFASGNYMSIIACLMQLRKVCNHPDLFEERQIVTSFAMPKSAVAEYEIKELLVRRRLKNEESIVSPSLDILGLWQPNVSSAKMERSSALNANRLLLNALRREKYRLDHDPASEHQASFSSSLSALRLEFQRYNFNELYRVQNEATIQFQRRPVLSETLLEQLRLDDSSCTSAFRTRKTWTLSDQYLSRSDVLQSLLSISPALSDATHTFIQKYGCITPAVVAPNLNKLTLTNEGVKIVQSYQSQNGSNPFHESQTRLSIAFPDKALIQYDCGKLQQLDRLLRELTSAGHRALIFTQMTKVLNILEQFLNLHGYRYLRLDGATKVEQRQALTDQFNRDPRISVLILSSRSGGLGINLTGADTVIFYDLDWNPAMDKQCQDRCHRIGQTRDVHIYRFVSEGTIEANILRKSNQKRLLDDVVIQEGEFTTDVFNRELMDDLDADADAALDMVIGGGDGSAQASRQNERVLANAEDKEDHDAAILAHKEYVHTDEADFREKPASVGTGTNTPDAKTYDSPRPISNVDEPTAAEGGEGAEEDEPGSYEEYMLRFMEWDLRDMVIKPLSRGKKKGKQSKDQGVRIRR